MAETFEFHSPKIEKGRFTLENTGEYRDFSLNTNEINDTKGHDYPRFKVPGTSQPIIQGGVGTERLISFVLHLDGDVGYRNRRRQQPNVTQSAPITMSIKDEIAWYRQFLYSEGNARLGSPDSQPPIVLFTFGGMYRGLRCVMRTCDVRVTAHCPNLDPRVADLRIALEEKILFTVNRSEIYDLGENLGF